MTQSHIIATYSHVTGEDKSEDVVEHEDGWHCALNHEKYYYLSTLGPLL
jgi:hypothetical protein